MENSDKTNIDNWGGLWTEQKLDTFESYVKAYLTIMNVYREKYNWKLIYFDGFAGSGTRSKEELEDEHRKSLDLFEGNVDDDEMKVYQGAAERVVRLEEKMRGFDFYYFIDLKEDNCLRLELKLRQYPVTGLMQFRPGDANMAARQLGNALKNKPYLKALALLDPFGMNLEWATIESIACKGIDLWILIPSGVIVNRLLDKHAQLIHHEKLSSFFGMSKEEIRKWFYEEKTEIDLFAEERVWYQKVDNPIKRIADLYVERLGELFPYVTPEPLVMRNSRYVPIFHFVCASYNSTAVKIAQQIITKRQ